MRKAAFIIYFLFISIISFCQITATTDDGRKVLLNEDGTYTWVDEQEKSNEEDQSVTESNLYIGKYTDEMTDKVYYLSSERLLGLSSDKKEGFSLTFSFNGKEDDKVKIDGLSAKVVGLDCLEKVELIFLFEDGTKFSLTNWNDFNCKGNAWYSISETQISELATKKLDKIRFQNGRNYKSYTHTLEGSDKDYFINLYKSFKDKDFRIREFDE